MHPFRKKVIIENASSVNSRLRITPFFFYNFVVDHTYFIDTYLILLTVFKDDVHI